MPGFHTLKNCWQWIRNKVSVTLCWALLLSLLVHLQLLSGIDWSLWNEKHTDVSPIQARLQALPQRVSSVPVASTVKTKPAVHRPYRTSRPPVKTVDTTAPPTTAMPVPEPVAEALTAPVSEPEPPIDQADNSNAGSEEESSPTIEEDSIAQLPAPYQSVDTTYDLFLDNQKQAAGSATIHYQAESDQYTLRWEIKGSGLLSLLYPKLVQESNGTIEPSYGLRPTHYRYAFGNRANKTYEAAFDWAQRLITLKTNKGETTYDLPNNTQDLLSFMYQFMFMPPLQEMRVSLTNGKRIGEYQYSFEGEEDITVAGQALHTMHIAHSRGDTDEKIDLWVAVDYRNVPVKIRKTEKNGMVIEQIATSLIAQ